jgi:rSAM/selenodomain-associated transferase 1
VKPALLVIAKAPVAGRVKTRLCPPCTPEQAARLARAALQDTLATAGAVAGCGRRVVVLDGQPGDWLPSGWEVIAQHGDGLAERLAAAFADVGEPALLIGMDTPQVRADQLENGLAALACADAVLGAAPDGGYWAIGLRIPARAVFAGVPMSEAHTYDAQRRRLAALGLRTARLAPLRDVDTIEDARAIAAAAPDGRFGAALRALEPPLVTA